MLGVCLKVRAYIQMTCVQIASDGGPLLSGLNSTVLLITLSLYTLSERGLSINSTEFIFFVLSCLQNRITHQGQCLSDTIPRKYPSSQTLKFDWGLIQYVGLIYFLMGTAGLVQTSICNS